jgi:aconitate hydratase A / 2-methylisocitrate dehydratase
MLPAIRLTTSLLKLSPCDDLLDILPGDPQAASFVSLERAESLGLCPASRLPFTLRILAECALRRAADPSVVDLSFLDQRPRGGILEFYPARLLLQDFTGVPLMTDLASMRDAVVARGADPRRVSPKLPVDFVLDHALIAEYGGRPDARDLNERIEIERNRERFGFLKWCAGAFDNIRLLPPGAGIMHQLNIEYLASVVRTEPVANRTLAIPDTLLGADSHTTMAGGLGVLGWGVGGIEAQAAMLGQPTLVSRPRVIGLRLEGELPPGTISTDLVLHVCELLRKHDVTGAFVEAWGDGVARMPVETRATIANMAPEYGAASVYFAIDDATLRYLRLTGRDEEHVRRVESFAKSQLLWQARGSSIDPSIYDAVVDFDLSSVEPSVAGPTRPQQRVALSAARDSFERAFAQHGGQAFSKNAGRASLEPTDRQRPLRDGDVVIAAVTSCANTANPTAMIAAGLLARNAARRGLSVKPWVKTSFAPGSRVVSAYLNAAGLQPDLDALGFHVIGFGCTTCNGNSGPLAAGLEQDIITRDLTAVAVLSGNRNFEGRIHPLVRAAYLASPALVIAYALTGTVLCDLTRDPIGIGADGRHVMLSEIWPTDVEIAELSACVTTDQYRDAYGKDLTGHAGWRAVASPTGVHYPWDADSTFLAPSPLDEFGGNDAAGDVIDGLRALAVFGDGITTDHLSPNGEIRPGTPAAAYLAERSVAPRDFGTYAARRGHYAVAVRGTFANPHLRNEMLDGARGGLTILLPDGKRCSIFEAAQTYRARGVPAIVIAGKSYGSGSSRDWAAKGPRCLGVRAVLAESFERIHRSNLVAVGILPLVFLDGAGRTSLALTGHETFRLRGLSAGVTPGGVLQLDVIRESGATDSVALGIDLETAYERQLLRAGGLFSVLLDELAADGR